MELSLTVFNQVIVMFLLMGVGALAFKTKIISEQTNKQLSDVVLLIVNPCIIISAYYTKYDKNLAIGLLICFVFAVLTHIVGIILSTFLIKKNSSRDFSLERFSCVYSNCGFFAIPLVYAVLGPSGVLFLTAYITVFNLFIWTHGIFIISGQKNKNLLLQTLKTPVLISIFVGLFLFFTQIKLPSSLIEANNFIAKMNTPLAMFVSGVYVAQSNIFKALKIPKIYLISVIKLLLIPIIMIIIMKLLQVGNDQLFVVLIGAATPTGVTGILFSSKFNKNPILASEIVGITTILSIITIPFMVFLSSVI